MLTVTITNEYLAVKIRLVGGALTSVYDVKRQEELLYQPRPDAWDDQDVIIFPFIGRLKDKFYELDGKRYNMDIHGIAHTSAFTVFEYAAHRVTLRLTHNEETLKSYPFPFELNVTYALCGDKLTTTFTVINRGKAELPFMLGGHPGYRLDCDERSDGTDTSGNFLVIPHRRYEYLTLDDLGCFITGRKTLETAGFELAKDLFKQYGTLMLCDFEGTLLLRKRTRTLKFELEKTPVLAFWSNPQYGDYVCIEPWLGRPDDAQPIREWRDKPLMNKLPAGETFTYTYAMQLQ